MHKFYVRPVTAKGKIIGYGIYDCVGGIESQHEFFRVTHPSDKAFVHMTAKSKCDEMNGISPND